MMRTTMPCRPYRIADARFLRHKARSIELQAGHAAPALAAQLRALATQYYAEAEALMTRAPADTTRRHGPRTAAASLDQGESQCAPRG
jgi:hypothetical protein